MSTPFVPAGGLLGQLSLLRIECRGPVVHLRLMRPDKRNAISDTLIQQTEPSLCRCGWRRQKQR